MLNQGATYALVLEHFIAEISTVATTISKWVKMTLPKLYEKSIWINVINTRDNTSLEIISMLSI